jgi:hypothetical protein
VIGVGVELPGDAILAGAHRHAGLERWSQSGSAAASPGGAPPARDTFRL